jgi:N-acetylmuramate 1-kinase
MKSNDEMSACAQDFLKLSPDTKIELLPLDGRGSDRAYFRFRWSPDNSVILVNYDGNRVENACFADIARYLHEIGIPVPQILNHDRIGCFIIIKDLGNTDLWSLRNAPWEIRRKLYQKTLDAAHRLHSISERDFPSSRVTLMEAFGPNLYRWERNYFKDNFIKGLCGIVLNADFEWQLEEELVQLAERLACGRRSLVHRDLQSQNVLIYHDDPFLIDFQGMRFGSPFYDLGSLLCDPYVAFTEAERRELLSFYFGLSPSDTGWESFEKMFWEASAQRLMQALGAYGFLGLVKGLKNYLIHVPSGLANLRAAAENADSLPMLLETCEKCAKALQSSNKLHES